jgi:hypothetical protein
LGQFTLNKTLRRFMKSVNCPKPDYTSITCSKIGNITKNLIFTTKFNDSSISIAIISWDYLNLSVTYEYVSDVTIPTQVIKYNQCCSRWISRSDCSIHIKLNYLSLPQLFFFGQLPSTHSYLIWFKIFFNFIFMFTSIEKTPYKPYISLYL